MATKKQAQATKVRVLVEGHYGKPDDVIELEGEALAVAVASGQVDAHPEAVAYALENGPGARQYNPERG